MLSKIKNRIIEVFVFSIALLAGVYYFETKSSSTVVRMTASESKPLSKFDDRVMSEISQGINKVTEFRSIRENQISMHSDFFLFDKSAQVFAQYVYDDMIQQSSGAHFPNKRFDYSYDDIFPSGQPLDLIVWGDEGQVKKQLLDAVPSLRGKELKIRSVHEAIVDKIPALEIIRLPDSKEAVLQPIGIIDLRLSSKATVRDLLSTDGSPAKFLKNLTISSQKDTPVNGPVLRQEKDSFLKDFDLGSSKSATEFMKKVKYLKLEYQISSPEMADSFLDKDIQANLQKFKSLLPTIQQIIQIREMTQVSNEIFLDGHILEKAETAGQFIRLLGVNGHYLSDEGKRILIKNADLFASKSPNADEVRLALSALEYDTSGFLILSKALIGQTKNPRDFLAAARPRSLHEGYYVFSEQITEVVTQNLDHFLSMKPTKKNLDELMGLSLHPSYTLKVAGELLKRAKTADDFIFAVTVYANPYDDSGKVENLEKFRETIQMLSLKNYEAFLKTNPTSEQRAVFFLATQKIREKSPKFLQSSFEEAPIGNFVKIDDDRFFLKIAEKETASKFTFASSFLGTDPEMRRYTFADFNGKTFEIGQLKSGTFKIPDVKLFESYKATPTKNISKLSCDAVFGP